MRTSLPKEKSEDLQKGSDLFRRRAFLRSAGFVTASSAVLLSGCQHYLDELLDGDSDDYVGEIIRLGAGDIGVLNYAYTLEQLEAEFYKRVVENPSFTSVFTQSDQEFIRDIGNHEIAHKDFFKAALGENAIPTLRFNFSSVDFSDRSVVLKTAKTFEDLGVAAYNGAGRLLQSKELLALAGKIVSVEARHASYIREIIGIYEPDADPTAFAGDDIIDENGLDRALTPTQVLTLAAPFILPKIDANALS